MNVIFYLGFGVTFICLLVRTLFHIREFRKGPYENPKKMYRLFSITTFFFWCGWFCMSCWDPVRMKFPGWVTFIGLGLFVIGVVFVVLSHLKIKGFQSGTLIHSGVYAKFRHPMYLGFILWFIGFPLFMKALITLLSAVLWIPQILYWKVCEEKELEEKYSDYKEYKKRTWF